MKGVAITQNKNPLLQVVTHMSHLPNFGGGKADQCIDFKEAASSVDGEPRGRTPLKRHVSMRATMGATVNAAEPTQMMTDLPRLGHAKALESISSLVGLTMQHVELGPLRGMLTMLHYEVMTKGKNGVNRKQDFVGVDSFLLVFLTAWLQHLDAEGEQMAALFRKYDIDNSGQLEFSEFAELVRHATKAAPTHLSEHDIRRLYVEAVEESDGGEINEEAFVTLVQQHLKAYLTTEVATQIFLQYASNRFPCTRTLMIRPRQR
jgi:hypothetical protein